MDARTRNLWLGLGGGIAVTMLFPIVAPVVREIARPVTKAMLRGGLLGVDLARTSAARLSESLEDVYAEVSAELANRRHARATSASQIRVVAQAADEVGGGPQAVGR